MKFLRTALSFALIAFVLSSSAFAIPPEKSTFAIPVSGNLGDCGDFEILREAEYTVTETVFFDDAGNVARVTWWFDGTETFINSETEFAIAGMPSNALLVFTNDGKQLTRGFLLGAHVPGMGVVLLNAGNVTYDLTTTPFTIIFERGTFDNLFFSDDDPDLERLCTALEGPATKPNDGETTWGLVKRLYR